MGDERRERGEGGEFLPSLVSPYFWRKSFSSFFSVSAIWSDLE